MPSHSRLYKRYFSSRASAIGLVLAVATLALLAAFTAAGVAMMNLNVASRLSNAAIAQNLAESVVAEATAKLQVDLGFHEDIEIKDGLGLPLGSWGRLSFNKSAGIPYSSNNFLDNQPDGWKRTLPNHTTHLIGVGESGGVTRYSEVILYQPQYPIALACDGPVKLKNSAILAFTPTEERPWVAGSGYDVAEEEIKPGNLITNSDSATAVVLDKKSKISGDLQAVGKAQLNGARVEGEVRAPWGQRAPLPKFDIAKFDPEKNEDTYYEDLSETGMSLKLTGNSRYQGNLTLTGDLNLDNAFLFVNGDLNINGAFKGIGTIVVSGKCSFKGAVEIESNEQIALISGGGIEAIGESSKRSIFKGLLYTKGPFVATKITILGGFVVDNAAPAEIVDCEIFYSGQFITPKQKREAFAVVSRFVIPTEEKLAQSLKINGDDPVPSATWQAPGTNFVRNVKNVLDQKDPNWARSQWSTTDPAVIRVRWVNNKPQYSYHWWGLDPGSGVELGDVGNTNGAVAGEYRCDSLEELVNWAYVNNNNANTEKHLGFIPYPGHSGEVAYKAYLTTVGKYLTNPRFNIESTNYSLDPNEFIVDGEELRVLMHRTF